MCFYILSLYIIIGLIYENIYYLHTVIFTWFIKSMMLVLHWNLFWRDKKSLFMVDLKISLNYFRYILCAKYKLTFRPIFHAQIMNRFTIMIAVYYDTV